MIKEPTRILIVRMSALGDVVHTLPLLAAIRMRYPHAFVGWLADKQTYQIIREHPMVDKVHVTDRKNWFRKETNPLELWQTAREIWDLVQSIRKMHYEVAIDAQGLLTSAMFPFLCGIPNRVGFFPSREKADYFYNVKVDRKVPEKDPDVPFYDHLMELAQQIDCRAYTPSYPLPRVNQGERHRINRLLMSLPKEKPLIAMAPFTAWPSKNWPQDHWVKLITMVFEQTDYNVVLVGGDKDTEDAGEIIKQLPLNGGPQRILNLCGQVSLRELRYLYEKTSLMIGGDSFPTHVAGAVNRSPIIALYGPTSIRRTPPAREPGGQPVVFHTLEQELSCIPCHKRHCPIETQDCLVNISPEEVFASIQTHMPARIVEGELI